MYCCRHRNVTMCEYRNPILAMNINERNLNHLGNLALSFQIAVRSQTTSFSLALSCLILQSDGWIFCGVGVYIQGLRRIPWCTKKSFIFYRQSVSSLCFAVLSSRKTHANPTQHIPNHIPYFLVLWSRFLLQSILLV